MGNRQAIRLTDRVRATYLALAGIILLAWMIPAGALLFAQTLEAHTGDLVAANINDHSVTVFDGATGQYKGVFVAPEAGGLRNPTGVAFGPDEHLYVSSSATNRILRYDGRTGVFLGTFVSDIPRPFSLIFGSDSTLYVSSGSEHNVRRYDSAGRLMNIAAAGGGLRQPIGLALAGNGDLLVANSGGGNILRFDPSDGSFLSIFASDSLQFPSDVAFAPTGEHVYVSSAGGRRVVRFDAETGAFESVVPLPDGSVPVGLAFAGPHKLFVADFGASRLVVLDTATGIASITATRGLAGPENIAIKP